MQQTKILNLGKGRSIKIPVNYQDFILDYSSNPENQNYNREDIIYILECVKNGQLEDLDMDSNLMNDIGTFFENGVCVKADINAAVYWYEQAVEWGNDLARSNLADILCKGSQGYPKDLRRAFDLYKECGLPYAHYRVGEFYEHGWGVRQDLEAAKAYYRLAYREGHGLANKKLKEWNFLEGTTRNIPRNISDGGNELELETKKYEVRCHEWGDNSDYHWCYCDTKEEAVETVKDFYAHDPGNAYEHLYVLEIKPDGTKKNVPVD